MLITGSIGRGKYRIGGPAATVLFHAASLLCSLFVISPAVAAERDGDRILAVIAGTAVNAAGAAPWSFTLRYHVPEYARWQARQAERHRAEPGHRYSLARYGLTAPQVDAAFGRYAEFVRGNKIRLN